MLSIPRPRKRGALTIVSLIFVASAILRIGDETGKAWALSEPAPVASAEPEATCIAEDGLSDLLQAMQAKSQELVVLEAELLKRSAAIDAADGELTKRLAELREAEAGLRGLVEIAESASEKDIDRLVAVYEAMKPKEAALLFQTMEPQFAAGFLGRLRPETAAGILSGMPPEAAYSLSAIVAGRNARAPKE